MTKWSRDDLKSMAERYNKVLRLTSNAVGIKLFEKSEEIEQIIDNDGHPIQQVNRPLVLCQFIAQPRYLDMVHTAKAENLCLCPPGGVALGFMTMPEVFPQGYVGKYYSSYEISMKLAKAMPVLPLGKYKAIIAAPLSSMPVNPDVVSFFGNTAQIHRIVQAYTWNLGERLTFSASGQDWCADALVAPILTGKPHIAFACRGSLICAWPSDNELSIGVPAAELERILEGLEFQHKGGVRYPVMWHHVTWELGEPLATRFKPPKFGT